MTLWSWGVGFEPATPAVCAAKQVPLGYALTVQCSCTGGNALGGAPWGCGASEEVPLGGKTANCRTRQVPMCPLKQRRGRNGGRCWVRTSDPCRV